MPRCVVGSFLVVVAALVLSACQMSEPAANGPDPQVAVEGALASLEREAMIGYRFPGGTALDVSSTGLAQGTLFPHDQQVHILRAGGSVYVRGPAEYWRSQGMSAERAGQYGARWARSILALDPGRALAPNSLARAFRSAIPPGTQAERLTLGDGTELFDVDGLQVTAAQPYRVTSFRPSLLGPLGQQVLGNSPVELQGLSADGLADFRTALRRDVDDLGQPFVAGPAVAASVTKNTMRCAASGSCTDTVEVTPQLLGDAPQALARLVLTSSVTSNQLGSRECGQELVVPLNEPVTMSCSVKFAVPRTGGATKVSGVPTVTAEPVAVLDLAGIKQEIASTLGA